MWTPCSCHQMMRTLLKDLCCLELLALLLDLLNLVLLFITNCVGFGNIAVRGSMPNGHPNDWHSSFSASRTCCLMSCFAANTKPDWRRTCLALMFKMGSSHNTACPKITKTHHKMLFCSKLPTNKKQASLIGLQHPSNWSWKFANCHLACSPQAKQMRNISVCDFQSVASKKMTMRLFLCKHLELMLRASCLCCHCRTFVLIYDCATLLSFFLSICFPTHFGKHNPWNCLTQIQTTLQCIATNNSTLLKDLTQSAHPACCVLSSVANMTMILLLCIRPDSKWTKCDFQLRELHMSNRIDKPPCWCRAETAGLLAAVSIAAAGDTLSWHTANNTW